MSEENSEKLAENNAPVPPPPGLRKIFHKGKKAGKQAIKNTSSTFRGGLRNIWISLVTKYKIILIIILTIVLFSAFTILVLADYSVNVSSSSVSNYISQMGTSSNSSKFYNRTGSLLLMKEEDLKNIAEDYLEETELSNNNLHQLMKKEYGKDSLSDDKAVSLNEKKSLYEHFLNTEKYNFNRINWVKYNRSKESGNPKMKVDIETRLQYPEDDDNTSLQTLANMFQPYIQNYMIPYSLYVGILTDARTNSSIEEDDSKQLKFGYELLKSAYHDIQVNQYNMERYIMTTTQNVYDVFDITITHSVTYKNGKITKNGKKKANITLKDSCVQDSVQTITDKPETYVKYKLKYAKVFDKIIINEYEYTEYNTKNEPDDQTISRTIYKDENYINYENENYTIPEENYGFEYDDDDSIEDGTYTATYTFEAKKGYTDTITSTWKDLLVQLSHEERAYTVKDVEEYSGNKLSSSEKNYYKQYEYKTEDDELLDRLNIFDIVNSKKDVYKNYLRDGENYSKNIGYPRSWLVYSYDALKRSVKNITEGESGWKYFYGSSIGAEEATSVSSGDTTYSSDLSGVDYSNLPEGKLGWPSPGHFTISSYFGPRSGGHHNGIDISMPLGSEFVAAASGKVIAANSTCTDNYGKPEAINSGKTYCGGNMGNYVKIQVDGTDMVLTYMHMTSVIVEAGQEVKAGDPIGTCGTTGRSTGSHAHFEVRIGGKAINPLDLLEKE